MNLKETKTTPKAQETRRRIFEVALELFQEQGFEQTTMRQIAKQAGMALGASYYYFKTKEEIVVAFYQQTQTEFTELSREMMEQRMNVKKRIKTLINLKLKQFTPYRSFLNVLFKTAGDPKHPLSPFSPESAAIRQEAIEIFARALQDSRLKISNDLKDHLPYLFWLYQMGIILYWLHDDSPGQAQTEKLLQSSLELIFQLLRLSRVPGLRSSRRTLLKLFEEIGLNKLPKAEKNSS